MMTRRPRPSPFTPAPSVSIVPATSQPLTWGSPSGGGKRPSSRSMSTWLSAHARTRTTTSSGPGAGSRESSYRIFSAPPCSLKNAALTRGLLSERHLGALVLHASGLVVPPGQGPRFADLDRHADPEPGAQIVGEARREPQALGARQGRRGVDADQDVVESRVTPEDDLKFVDATVRPYQLFDAPRVDDHPTNLLHVVEPREDAALEGEQRAAARARPLGDLDHVARAVPEERHRLPVEAREDQLAAPAPTVRPVHGVQDLGIAVVLVHVHEPGARVALEPPRGELGEPGKGQRPPAQRRLGLRLPRGDRGARLGPRS